MSKITNPAILNILEEAKNPHQPDSVVKSVINKFMDRAAMGYKKYGKDLDRTDLSALDWINHAQEEHMDAILYLEKLKKTLVGG
jgi:hypothetical protein